MNVLGSGWLLENLASLCTGCAFPEQEKCQYQGPDVTHLVPCNVHPFFLEPPLFWCQRVNNGLLNVIVWADSKPGRFQIDFRRIEEGNRKYMVRERKWGWEQPKLALTRKLWADPYCSAAVIWGDSICIWVSTHSNKSFLHFTAWILQVQLFLPLFLSGNFLRTGQNDRLTELKTGEATLASGNK